MLLVESFRDYFDYINMAPSIVNGEVDLVEFIKATIIYGAQSVIGVIWYIISFQWLFGFVEIPIVLRQSYTSVIQGEPLLDSNIELAFHQGIFTFLETSNSHSNNLFTGLLNSFFLAIPGSVSQILTLRLFLINGAPSALFSALGMWIGQFSFLTCVLFGLEFILLPWFEFQPLVMAVGAFFTIKIVHRLWYTDPYTKENEEQGFAAVNRKSMFQFFRTTLGLSWCEQMCMFSSLSNITLTSGSTTIFQTSDSNYFFSTFTYLIGLTIGSILWTVLWGYIGIWVRNQFLDLPSFFGPFKISYRQFLLYFHRGSLITALSFSLVTFPYYGADYVIGNTLGFSAEDHNLTSTITPIQIELTAPIDWKATRALKQPLGLTPTSIVYDYYDQGKTRYKEDLLYIDEDDDDQEFQFLVAPMDSRAQSRISVPQFEEHTYGPDKRLLNLYRDRKKTGTSDDDGQEGLLDRLNIFKDRSQEAQTKKGKKGQGKIGSDDKEGTKKLSSSSDDDEKEDQEDDESRYKSPFKQPYIFSPYVSTKVQQYEDLLQKTKKRIEEDDLADRYNDYRLEEATNIRVKRSKDLNDYRFRMEFDMTREEVERGKKIYESRLNDPKVKAERENESPENRTLRLGMEAAMRNKNDTSSGFNKEHHIEKIVNFLDRPDEYCRNINSDEADSLHSDLELSREKIEAPILFRDKYFANPVWNLFLKLDMYSFLLGQSRDQAVNAEEEHGLFEHRRLIQKYANGLIDFKDSDKQKTNFAKLVTNNQFKGSLELLREYKFANFFEYAEKENFEQESNKTVNIDLSKKADKDSNENANKSLNKQPGKDGSKDPEPNNNSKEESSDVFDNDEEDLNDDFDEKGLKKYKPTLKVLKYDQAYFYDNDKEDFMFHEELDLDDQANNEKDEKLNPSSLTEKLKRRFADEKELFNLLNRETLIEETLDQSVPMYIGWDGNLRKFLVKTHISPSQISIADEISFDPNDNELNLLTANEKNSDAQEDNSDLNSVYQNINGNNQSKSTNEGSTQKTETIQQQNEKNTPYFGIETSKLKKDIPSHYRFQAWSKGTENLAPGEFLKAHLPGANYTDTQKYALKVFFELLYDQPKYDRDPKFDVETDMDRKDRLTREMLRDEADDILDRLPNYNWFWLRRSSDHVMSAGGFIPPEDEAVVLKADTSTAPRALQEKYKKNKMGLIKETDPLLYAHLCKRLYQFNGYFHLGNSVPPKLSGLAWPGIEDPSLGDPHFDTIGLFKREDKDIPAKSYDLRRPYDPTAAKKLKEDRLARKEKQKDIEAKKELVKKLVAEGKVEKRRRKFLFFYF